MNISPIESKMIEFIKRPENMEKITKLNNKNEKSKLEEAPKQNRLEDQSLKSNEVEQKEESLFNMVKEVLDEINVNNVDVNIGFKFRDDFDEPIIEVIDKDSEEVIRQIPTEEFISRVKNLEDIKGMLFDDKI